MPYGFEERKCKTAKMTRQIPLLNVFFELQPGTYAVCARHNYPDNCGKINTTLLPLSRHQFVSTSRQAAIDLGPGKAPVLPESPNMDQNCEHSSSLLECRQSFHSHPDRRLGLRPS